MKIKFVDISFFLVETNRKVIFYNFFLRKLNGEKPKKSFFEFVNFEVLNQFYKNLFPN